MAVDEKRRIEVLERQEKIEADVLAVAVHEPGLGGPVCDRPAEVG